VVVVLVADVPSWLALGCFFLKKDILPALNPMMDGMVSRTDYIVYVCFDDETQGVKIGAKGGG
jgi:hypothetical protein